MPPRKKQKRAAPDTPQPEDTKQSASTTSARDSAPKSDTEYDLVNDPWTDEQETALLKGLVRWKPVGIHKHFRMIAISEYMKTQGYAPLNEEHTRIPGIWKKLNSLYNLPALDEREDSIITADADESDESEYCPFELPEEEYGEMMFARRLASRRSESVETSVHPESRRGSTVADTDGETKPNSSPAPSRGRRGGKSTRASTRGTRSTRLQLEVEQPSPDNASEDEEMEDADANEGDDEAGENTDGAEEDNEEEEPDAETPSSPAARNTRTQTSKSNKRDKKSSAAPSTAAGTATRRTGRRR